MDRYEEVIIKMRDFVERYKYYTTSEGGNMYKDLINIFPELAESEDEKIRKELLEHCKNQAKPYIQTGNECPQIQSWIAWLEKQNSNVANKEYWRGYREGKQEILDKYANLEKQDESKNIDSDDLETLEIWEDAIKENKEKWQLSDWFIEATSLLIKKVKRIENNENINIKGSKIMLNACINALKTTGHPHLSDWLEKQGEQKPADEPKFKVGDWVVYNNDICQIVKREEGCNKLVTVFGIEKELVNERNLSTARLWSITDAKDGDVLSDGTTIFIFKDLLSDSSVMSYCDYDTNSGESDAFCPLSMNLVCSKITPAAKEQRDTLLKAMADAGYTFDFEKKKLKKIVDEEQIKKNLQNNDFRRMFEQKSVWSERDAGYIKDLISYFSQNEKLGNTKEDVIAWLKSLKERVQL